MLVIGHDKVLVSLAAPHFINGIIKQSRKLSINLVDESILPQADYAGAVSGARESKADLFDYEIGENGAPIIRSSPLSMECTVRDMYNTTGFENFICSIDSTYVEESCLDKSDKIDYRALKPVLFEFPTYQYLRTGDVIGKCLSLQNNERV